MSETIVDSEPSFFSKKSLVVFFVIVGFSIYYGLYFMSFDQSGDNSNKFVNLLKLGSVGSLFFYFYKSKLKLNAFDFLYLWSSLVLTIIFLVNSFTFGFEDKLFINYMLFAFLYPFLVSKDYSNEIYFSYTVLSFSLCIQILFDFIIKFFSISRLWEEGVFVGGMGNPSSFAFACLFSMTYLLTGPQQVKGFLKWVLLTILAFGIIYTNSLFVILLMILLFIYILYINTSFLQKVGLVFLGIISLWQLWIWKIKFSDNLLLKSKIISVLKYVTGSTVNQSDSVYLRLKNITIFNGLINNLDEYLLFGHYKNLNYFSLDSQYITWGLSFGLVGLISFLFFLFATTLRLVIIKQKQKEFLSIAFIFFILIFFNNRILDYFPIGYLFVTMLVLISQDQKKKLFK